LQHIEIVGEKRPKFRGFHPERRANETKLAGEFRLYCGAGWNFLKQAFSGAMAEAARKFTPHDLCLIYSEQDPRVSTVRVHTRGPARLPWFGAGLSL
jgi:hypothetical protein